MTTELSLVGPVRVASLKQIEMFGSSRSQFLNQIHFWLQNKNTKGRIHEDQKWIYNTYDTWAKQLACSVRTIERHVAFFKERGIIKTANLCKNKFYHVNYYTLNYDLLTEFFSEESEFSSNSNEKRTECRDRRPHDDGIYIQRKHTKINNNSSESGLSKDLVNFCDNFKNLAKEDVSNQTPLNIQEEILQDNSSQEETFVKEELSQPEYFNQTSKKIDKKPLNQRKPNPFNL